MNISQWDVDSSRHVVNVAKTSHALLTSAGISSVNVLDVGSNVGKFVELLSEYGIQVKHAVLCDIIPELVEYTKKKFPQYISLNVAVSDVDGETVKCVSSMSDPHNLGTSRIVSDVGESSRHLLVLAETMTVPTIVAKTSMLPDVIKIDAEGHDLHVVKGVIGLIKCIPSCRPLIVFECAAGVDTLEVVNKLHGIGYITATHVPATASRDIYAIPFEFMNEKVKAYLVDMPFRY